MEGLVACALRLEHRAVEGYHGGFEGLRGRIRRLHPGRAAAALHARQRHVRPERALLGLVEPGGGERAARRRPAARRRRRRGRRGRARTGAGRAWARERGPTAASATGGKPAIGSKALRRRCGPRRARTASRGRRASRAGTPRAPAAAPRGRRATPSRHAARRAADVLGQLQRHEEACSRAPGALAAHPPKGSSSPRRRRRRRCMPTVVERSRMSLRSPGSWVSRASFEPSASLQHQQT